MPFATASRVFGVDATVSIAGCARACATTASAAAELYHVKAPCMKANDVVELRGGGGRQLAPASGDRCTTKPGQLSGSVTS